MQRPRTTNRVATLSISAIIPAFNEEKTVGEIVSKTLKYVDEVIVIDDGSTDDTGVKAANAGARVIRNEENAGILKSLKVGFESALGDVIVTLDADGQHDPEEIPLLLGPILEEKADLVLGTRATVPYISERVIARLTSLRVAVRDASTGFRAIKADIAGIMDLHGSCSCGTLILEAKARGARIVEVPINVREREEGERRIQTRHFKQVLYVLYGLVRY